RNQFTIFLHFHSGSFILCSFILNWYNEVLHNQANYPNTALFVVSRIKVSGSGGDVEATDGVIKLVMPWLLTDSDLKPIGYECQVPQE
ncbi:hypothetical protein QUA62_25095, partial [Microcoleus sp. MON1_C1]|uniref:hypothetical protein n=1 Tax=Microcoleus sp. MON1_C1 TaxID=2818827 RepID=UPI002FD60103